MSALDEVGLPEAGARSSRPEFSPAALGVPSPHLVMDLGQLSRDFRSFVGCFPEAHIHYAMKSNPSPSILETLHREGCRFEVASFKELQALIAAGVEPSEVIYSNPVKP